MHDGLLSLHYRILHNSRLYPWILLSGERSCRRPASGSRLAALPRSRRNLCLYHLCGGLMSLRSRSSEWSCGVVSGRVLRTALDSYRSDLGVRGRHRHPKMASESVDLVVCQCIVGHKNVIALLELLECSAFHRLQRLVPLPSQCLHLRLQVSNYSHFLHVGLLDNLQTFPLFLDSFHEVLIIFVELDILFLPSFIPFFQLFQMLHHAREVPKLVKTSICSVRKDFHDPFTNFGIWRKSL